MSNDSEKTMRPAAEAEKTMRPAAEADKTMRPNAQADKTMRPNAQADKTMRPNSQADKTMRPNADSTLRPQKQQDEINRIIYQDETEFILGKGIKYQVAKIISKSTGEADIFLVEHKGKQFVLKLYFIGYKQNHDILNVITKSGGSGLLVDTLEHGVWTNPETQQERDYELMVYCEGGSLDQIKVSHDEKGEKLLGEIALKCACSIDFLHKQQIIHGDVKPANFFFRHKDQNIENLALADFGIAKQCNKDGVVNIPYQERTKIYAAPEYYDIIDKEIQINTKTDFFALGMTLLTLWCGEETYSNMNEFQLKDHKKHGTLSSPKDMSDRTLQLIKALTHPNPNVRASLAEVVRWVKGEEIYELASKKEDIRQFKILFSAEKNQTANSPEELAKFMLESKDLSTKYLYSGRIKDWLSDNLRPELAQEIEDITENQYPQDKEAGFYTACYLLDRAMPYYDAKNKATESSEEIAQSLINNFNQYQKALANKTDSLFLFFNARGAANVAQEFAPLFKKDSDNRDALLQLIHTLDPTLPWIITTDQNETIKCYKPEDVLNAKYEYAFSDESWDDLIGEAFLVWLRHVDPAVEGKIRSQKGYKKRQCVVLYNLSPKVAFNFQMDENTNDYFFTAEEIGNLMNLHMIDYIEDENNSAASDNLDMMCNIDNTQLYDYFKSKGVYDDKIDWIKYCADTQSKDNAGKAGPYNWSIGVYKAIKGLGYDPCYYFPKSKKYVYTLSELSQIPSKEIKEEMEKGYLQSWLTTCYQENPSLDLSAKYTYEKEVLKYLEHVEKLDAKNYDVENYKIGKNSVEEALTHLNRKHRFHVLSKTIIGLLTLIVGGIVIFSLLKLNLPIHAKDHKGWISLIAVISAIITVIAMYTSTDSEGLGNFIVGGISGVVVYAILYFLVPFIGYIAAGLLVVALIMLFVSCYLNYPAKSSSNKNLFKPTFEELELEPLHFAFSDDQTFKSSISDTSYNYAHYLSQGTKKFYKKLIFPWLLIFGMGYLAVWGATKSEQLAAQNLAEQELFGVLTGEWQGTFDNKNATFTITDANAKTADAAISVKYKTQLNETLKGKINLNKKSFHFDDVVKNGNLDGAYDGLFNDDFTEFSGTYKNYETQKTVKFNFKKGASSTTSSGETTTLPSGTKTSSAENDPQTANTVSAGTWSLTGEDSNNWTGKLVVESAGNTAFTGYIDWHKDGNNAGREYYQGSFNEKTRIATLKGTRLENPNGIGLGVYKATLSKNGDELTNGTWSGGSPGTWEAKLNK